MEKNDKVIRAVFKRIKEESLIDNSGCIKIKQNKTKANIKYFVKLVSLMLVSTLAGTIGSVYFIHQKYGAALSSGNRTIFQVINDSDFDGIQGNYIDKVVRKISESIVTVAADEESLKLGVENINNGSGIIIRSDGYIITSYSLVKDNQNILVKLSGGGSMPFKAKLIGVDSVSDLAILKIDADNLPKAKFADTDLMKAGDIVIALGNSVGDEYIGFVAAGIVNSKNKRIEVGNEKSADKKTYRVIQTSALINEENNGGPLCNINGEVVGINSYALTNKYIKNGSNYYYSVEIQDAEKIIDSILNYGKVKRIALGFDGASLIPKNNNELEGVYVQTITQNGSAAKAGMRPTDIIVELDGKKVGKLEDIMEILDKHKIGDTLPCRVLRAGQLKELSITLLESK